MTYEQKRQERISRLNFDTDCGAYGRLFELENAYTNSRKTDIAEQNLTDNFIRFAPKEGTTKKRYIPAESKTNGGRIDELLNGNRAKYVIYKLHLEVSHKAGKRTAGYIEIRDIPAVVIPVGLFIKKLKEFNAIKAVNRNGEFDGYAIQVSSKKWFQWLTSYPVLWNKEIDYSEQMFVGLE